MPAFFAEVSPQELRSTCWEDPSVVCRELLDATPIDGIRPTGVGGPRELRAASGATQSPGA